LVRRGRNKRHPDASRLWSVCDSTTVWRIADGWNIGEAQVRLSRNCPKTLAVDWLGVIA